MRFLRPGRRVRLCFIAAVGMGLGEGVSVDAQEAPTPRPWRLDLTTSAGYDDNVRFTPAMESDISGRYGARLTRSKRSPRTTFVLGASGDRNVFRKFPEFNRINYAADASLNYLVSPRTTLQVSETFARSYTSDAVVLINAGLFFPRTVSRTNNATIGVSHQISPRWNWTLTAGHQFYSFDSTLLRDGSSFFGRADLSWNAGPGSPIGLYYEFGRTSPRDRPHFDRHGATLRAAHRFGERLSGNLELGARTLTSQGSEPKRVVPTAGASVAVRSRNGKQTLQADATRSVSEPFGLDRVQVRTAVSLRYSRTLTSRLGMGLNANVYRSHDSGTSQDSSFVTRALGGNLRWGLARNVDLSAAGGYRRLDPPFTARTQSRFLNLTLTVGQDW